MIKILKTNNIKLLMFTMFVFCAFLIFPLQIQAIESITNELLVGQNNKITVSLKGPSGYTGGLGAEVEEVEFNYYFPQKPEDKFSTESSNSLTMDMMNTGKTDITVYSASTGKVDVVFAFKIIYKDNVKPTRLLTEQITFNFAPKTEKKTLASFYVGSEDNPSPFSVQIKDNNVYLPLDITMQILGSKLPPIDQLNIISINQIDFIDLGAGFHASPIGNDDNLIIEKVFDKKGNIYGIKIVKYVQIPIGKGERS